MNQSVQKYRFETNALDVVAFIDSLSGRQYEIDHEKYRFRCSMRAATDLTALICLSLEISRIPRPHAKGHARASTAQGAPGPCAKTRFRLVQRQTGQYTGYYSVDLVDPTAAQLEQDGTPAEHEAAIYAFLGQQCLRFIVFWLARDNGAPEPSATASDSSGRPPDMDYDWAYEQETALGRPRRIVYAEWLKRIGARARDLADPQDRYRSALAYRRRKSVEKGNCSPVIPAFAGMTGEQLQKKEKSYVLGQGFARLGLG